MSTLRDALENPQYRLTWLEKEVEILERKIEFFDGLSFKIKGWAIAIWTAVTTFALNKNEWEICALGGLVALLFMIVDASYKRYQMWFIERTRVIMAQLNEFDEEVNVERFPVYDLLNLHGKRLSEDPAVGRWGPILEYVRRSSVSLVYWILLFITIIITVLLIV
jgi:hypothetical protein